ncbi:MAG: response regulator [Verrucomicrobiota bacterium]
MNPPPKFIRVFLVEENVADERLVAEMLQDFGGGQFILCGVFRRLDEAIETLKNLGNADVVLLDLSLPDSQGLETFLRLTQAVPDQPVIVLSGQDDEAFAIETVRQGAQDYLVKTGLAGRLLVRSIHCAMERKRAELSLRTAREEMEKRMAERSSALDEANRRLSEVLEQLKTAQSLAIQQDRLLAMERLAGGIAHDFNNALSPILAHSEWLLRKPGAFSDEEALRKALCNIHESAGHCAEVVLRLRNFCLSRDEFAPFELLDAREVVQAAIALTQPSWKDQAQMRGCNIAVETDFASVPKIRGAREDLVEMFTNILLHSVDAITGNGVIGVRITGGPEGVSVCLSDNSVSTGAGAAAPSPEPGEVKGIGLGVIYGIAQRHGAEIHIGSWEENGTQVTVRFPVPKASREETIAPPQPAAAVAFRPLEGLRILAVEDDPNIREILGIYLKDEGHSVELAAEGEEALTKFEKDHFDLLLTDYSMPNMNGDRLAAAVREADPKIRIALLTGFGSQLPQGAPLRLEVDAIISKPFTFETLRQGIAEAMGG